MNSKIKRKTKILNSLEEVISLIKDGDCISFHHHLRAGDYLLNDCLALIKKKNIKNLTLACSAIFPNNDLEDLIKNKNIVNIHTNYLNGKTSNVITSGYLEGILYMHTHGGRARAIEATEIEIDVAILAVPTVSSDFCGTGCFGMSACGSLGYAVSDSLFAKTVVYVTDNFIDEVSNNYQLGPCDYLLKVAKLGDPSLIVSGTTKITKDPIQLKIAKDTASLIDELGLIKNGFSMQTGAGGTSLAVTHYIRNIMRAKNVKASFASGGILKIFVEMLEEGLIDELYDVQCFDLEAISSTRRNKNHHLMSASKYANPNNPEVIVDKLDFAILGATEIDINFNVNVTLDSYGNIIGGSGGHSDVAYGSKVCIVVVNLVKSRTPIIKEKVINITTPGNTIDVLVTERGIAINPLRSDLLEQLKNSKLKIVPIEQLLETAHKITSVPKKIQLSDKVCGYNIYRDGTIISKIYQKRI